ncbi:MAG: TonB family protein [Desulfobacteraceae bacterium]|nr:TonB family protein [Desulfobacteraceae bacterium]
MRDKTRQSEAVELYRPVAQFSSLGICLLISLFVHVAILGGLMLSPLGASDSRLTDRGKAINVDLVAMNPEVSAPPEKDAEQTASSETASAESSTPQKAEADEARPIPVKKSAKKNIPGDADVKMPEPPEPEVKTAMKKKTFDKEKVLEDAVRQMGEKSRQHRPKSIEDRIARMEKDAGDQGYPVQSGNSRNADTGGKAPSDEYTRMEIYQAEVAVLMKQNWTFNPDMAGSTKGLEARLVIRIQPDGTVSEVWYEKRSGNKYLDESAYKTVQKASPLPPLPEGRNQYHLVLGFTPTGLAQ